jgi:hypothetical protein
MSRPLMMQTKSSLERPVDLRKYWPPPGEGEEAGQVRWGAKNGRERGRGGEGKEGGKERGDEEGSR